LARGEEPPAYDRILKNGQPCRVVSEVNENVVEIEYPTGIRATAFKWDLR